MPSRKIDPLDFYSDQFQKGWAKLHKEIMDDTDEDDDDAGHIAVVVSYLDNLAQLLDELVYAAKPPKGKKSKKSKKSKKK